MQATQQGMPRTEGSNLRGNAAAQDFRILAAFALALVLLHVLVNGRYGFHRDELATLDDARYLAWGYVIYPPVTPFLGRVELELFGVSLQGFRFFPALAHGLALLLTGLSARELGGKREAQLVAASAVAVAGHSLFIGSFLSYTSLDYPLWVLVAYFVIRLLKSEDPRWWLAIGAAIGLGMMTKYTMGFLALGVVGGVLLTPARRYLRSPWLWCGAAVAVLVFLPHQLWEARHHFVSYEYLKSIHARDVRWGRANGFLLAQLWKSANPVTVPLWSVGLWHILATTAGKRYRLLGWMYLIPLVTLLAAKGRDYYLAPAYPMLLAAGAVWYEQWVNSLSARSASAVRQNTSWTLTVAGLIAASLTLPIAPINTAWWRVANAANGNFNYEIGWPELVETVVRIRDSLPEQDRARLGILARDDGEVGALNLYGPAYNLPRAISGMNSHWLRGYGDPPPETLIAIGWDRDFLQRRFESCELAGHLTNRYGVVNGSIDGYPDVFVCRHLRSGWPEFWERFEYYG